LTPVRVILVLAHGVLRVLIPFVVLVLVWQISVIVLRLPSYFYPAPSDVFAAFGQLIRNGMLPAYTQYSMVRWLVAISAAILLTIPFAVGLAFSRTLNVALMPYVNYLSSVAELAWLPLFVLWAGYGEGSVLLIICYGVFFPVLYNLMLGFRRVPDATIHAVRTLGARPKDLFFEVLLPGALPDLMTGVRIGAGYAFRGLIGGEIVAFRENGGLGFMLFQSLRDKLTQRTIVAMIVLGVIWLIIDHMYLRPLESATLERWGVLRGPS
jgi:NitT/TauT family transport system permease protein/taurine transport system permease protein